MTSTQTQKQTTRYICSNILHLVLLALLAMQAKKVTHYVKKHGSV